MESIPIEGVKDEILYIVLSSISQDYYIIDSRIADKINSIITHKLEGILNLNNS